MANLRGNSTVGGKPVVTVEMLDKMIPKNNFNPADWIPVVTPLLVANTDLNGLIATGYYRCQAPVNRPSFITGWAYIEVIRHDDSNVLQKIYNFEGTLSFTRTKLAGVWGAWRSINGGLTYKANGVIATWATDATTGLFTYNVTHNLATEDVSIAVIDSTKNSIESSFAIIDANTIKIYNDEKIDFRIIVSSI